MNMKILNFFNIMLNLTLNNQKSGYYLLAILMVQKTIKVKIENSSKGVPLLSEKY